MADPLRIADLVERFVANRAVYKSDAYKEAHVRIEFIDPLFSELGWDMANAAGVSEQFKDVVHEDALRMQEGAKAPDYSFRIGGARKFFVEAKRPSVNLETDAKPATQVRRYGWSAKLSVSVLTDFEGLAVYDCRFPTKPDDDARTARLFYIPCEEYVDRWDELEQLLSRDAVSGGSVERFAEKSKAKRGADEVDRAFLREIENWRIALATDIARRNPTLTTRQLNYCVQQTIDRVIFLRISEDRGIEPYEQLKGVLARSDAYPELVGLFKRADERYNSGLFHFSDETGRSEAPDKLTPSIDIGSDVIAGIIERLYYPTSPYEFSVLPADILGQVYEQFLGQVIVLDDQHQAKVEEKPEVKSAGGVFYTPTFIVESIIRSTVGVLLEGKDPADISGEAKVQPIRVLDPACGSGSFLIAAYDFLLEWYRSWYASNEPAKWMKGKAAKLYEAAGGEFRLTSAERKRILLAHIYGADIDPQAVEVTKLSLVLKLLEGESSESLFNQLELFRERALPDLGANVKCGNTLIGSDFYAQFQGEVFDEDAVYRINSFDWKAEFPQALAGHNKGFDAVIGNPPYVLLQDAFRDNQQLAYFRDIYKVAAFKLDTYHLFMERGLQLCRPGGRFSFIVPANFITNNGLAGLRRLLLKESHVHTIDVIDGGVFDGVSVDNAIFVIEAGRSTAAPFPVRHLQRVGNALVLLSEIAIDPERVLGTHDALFTGTSDVSTMALWDRVIESSVPLGQLAHVNFGKQLRDRTIYKDDVVKVAALGDIGKGYLPCYTGGDVERFCVTWNGLACSTDRSRKQGGTWDDSKQNRKNKLLTRQIGAYPTFAIDVHGFQCLNTMFMVSPKNERAGIELFLLGILNSTLLRAFWLDRFYDQRRTFPKIKGGYLEQLPIYWTEDTAKMDAVIDKVGKIAADLTSLHERHAVAGQAQEANFLSRQIMIHEAALDAAVADLYGITPAEADILRNLLPQ